MRQNDLLHLTAIIEDVSAHRELSRSDYVSLLILCRDPAIKGSMLKDLGHSVAHDARERGVAFEYLEKFARRIRMVFTHGGNLHVNLIFPIDEIIRELNSLLKSLKIASRVPVDDPEVRSSLASGIAHVLDGTTFRLKGATARLEVRVSEEYGDLYFATMWHDADIVGARFWDSSVGMSFVWLIDSGPKEITYVDSSTLSRSTIRFTGAL